MKPCMMGDPCDCAGISASDCREWKKYAKECMKRGLLTVDVFKKFLNETNAVMLLKNARNYAIEWGYPYGGPPEDPHCSFCGREYDRKKMSWEKNINVQDHTVDLHEEDCLLLNINKYLAGEDLMFYVGDV